MKAGQTYNPYRIFYGVFIPEWLAEATCFSGSAKVVFGVLARAARDTGQAEILQADVAHQAGVSPDAAWRYIKELGRHGLIKIERQGMGAPNLYSFLWTEMIDHASVRGLRESQTSDSDEIAGADSRPSAEPSSSTEEVLLRDTPGYRPEADQLCDLLADLIEANGSRRPVITNRWRAAARLMLDADGRTVEQVEVIARWAQADSFWKANIMSMPTLRDRFDQLRLKRNDEVRARRGKSQDLSPLKAAMQRERDRAAG